MSKEKSLRRHEDGEVWVCGIYEKTVISTVCWDDKLHVVWGHRLYDTKVPAGNVPDYDSTPHNYGIHVTELKSFNAWLEKMNYKLMPPEWSI